MEQEYSILVGGKAGDGIKQAGNSIARLFNRLGYWLFVYEDYPSLIKGGHNFAIVRAAPEKICAHKDGIDVLIALNQETAEQHASRLKKDSLIIFDSNVVKADGMGFPLTDIVKEMGLPPIVRNTAALGILAAVFDIDFSIVEDVISSSIKKKFVDSNIAIAKDLYGQAKGNKQLHKVSKLKNEPKPLLTGNEAIGLGAVKAGMKMYIAYPMTPSSTILHYLAANKDNFRITTVHPESEIAVIGMAQGAAYAGLRSMIGTSGGGFALMVEHLSLAGQAEIPTVVALAQRMGPATGVPTYTEQGDLFFALHAGHGFFPKIIVAPGDVEQAFKLSGDAMNLAWKFQSPVIILTDKHLSEETYSSEIDEGAVFPEDPKLWDGKGEYRRYLHTDDGVSLLAFPGNEKATVKLDSYDHDEFGVTTENPELIEKNHEKRLKKMNAIKEHLKKKETVKVYGNPKSENVIITWGSTKGAVVEVAEAHDLKVIQPLYLEPFPEWEVKKHLKGAKKVVDIELNTNAQLATILKLNDIKVDETILKYNGRPFTVNELEERLKGVVI